MEEKEKTYYFIVFKIHNRKEWYECQETLTNLGYKWCRGISYIDYLEMDMGVCIESGKYTQDSMYTTDVYKDTDFEVPYIKEIVEFFHSCNSNEIFDIKQFEKLIKPYTEANKLNLI